MTRLILLSLILLLSSTINAANYVDNPNFDITFPNCPSCLKGLNGWHISPFTTTVSYKERIPQGLLHSQYIEYSWEHKNYGGILYFGRTPTAGIFFYAMNGVPKDIPLYFAIEVGHAQDGPVRIEVELHEVSGGGDGRGGRVETSILSRQTVEINNKESWLVIASDYPAYKKHENWPLLLVITFPYRSSKVQLNYAQVGTDPKALGGRGARKKNFVTDGDL